MAVPDFQTFFRPVLELCTEREYTAPEILGPASDKLGLSAEDRDERTGQGTKTRAEDRVRWSLTHLYRAGLLERPSRGHYRATQRGRDLLAEFPDRITLTALERFQEYRDFRRRTLETSTERDQGTVPASEAAPVVEVTPTEAIERARRELEAETRLELLERLLDAPPMFFEQVVIDLLIAMGYGSSMEDAASALGGTGDGGVDGVIREDRLGLDLIYVQAKRYRDSAVSAEQVRSFAGALDDKGARKGVFITTSRFTADANRFAERQQLKRIVLVDGEMLTSLMFRHGVGVRTDRTITLKRIDLDYFEPDAG
jgi:restriction system protein